MVPEILGGNPYRSPTGHLNRKKAWTEQGNHNCRSLVKRVLMEGSKQINARFIYLIRSFEFMPEEDISTQCVLWILEVLRKMEITVPPVLRGILLFYASSQILGCSYA